MFEMFLCALFRRPYTIMDPIELAKLAELARYYTALPTVSESLHAAVRRNYFFVNRSLDDPCSVLVSAKAFRHSALIKDSLILSVGPWSNPSYQKLSDKELFRLADSLHSRSCVRLEEVQRSIIAVTAKYRCSLVEINEKAWSSPGEQMLAQAIECAEKKTSRASLDGERKSVKIGKPRMPFYYKSCSSIAFIPEAMGTEI